MSITPGTIAHLCGRNRQRQTPPIHFNLRQSTAQVALVVAGTGTAAHESELSRSNFMRICMESLGFVQPSVDSVLLFHIIDGKLAAIGIVHADDLILACRRLYDLTGIKAAFKWGAMRFAPEVLPFCGREIHDMGDHAMITQVACAEGSQHGDITNSLRSELRATRCLRPRRPLSTDHAVKLSAGWGIFPVQSRHHGRRQPVQVWPADAGTVQEALRIVGLHVSDEGRGHRSTPSAPRPRAADRGFVCGRQLRERAKPEVAGRPGRLLGDAGCFGRLRTRVSSRLEVRSAPPSRS